MKFLTIRQPWASLIGVGAKTIETRPFGTKYRGPLAIHAGAFRPVEGEEYGTGWYWEMDLDTPQIHQFDAVHAEHRWRTFPAPLGAVVAVCDLVDVLPIVDSCGGLPVVHVAVRPELTICRAWSTTVSDQEPYGDFTPGRYAWLLDNVRPVEPVPMKGALGLRDLPADVLAQLEVPA